MFLLFFVCSITWAFAGEANNFGSALGLSMKSFPPTPNIGGMGNVWAGLPSPYSSNPASYVHLRDYKLHGAVYYNYSPINTTIGPKINLNDVSGIINLGPGTLRLDYFDLNSKMSPTKLTTMGQNLKGAVDGKSFRIGYGFPITENFSVGLSTSPVYDTNVDFETSIYGKKMLVSKAKSHIRENFRIGSLYSPKKWIHFGIVYEYNRSKIKTTQLTPYGYKNTTNHLTMHLVRPGISVNPWKGGTIGLDYLWGRADGYIVNKFFFGVEQYVTPNLCIRLGSADKKFTAGFGLRWKNFIIDYAYTHNSIREMKEYFGSSPTHMVTLTFVW